MNTEKPKASLWEDGAAGQGKPDQAEKRRNSGLLHCQPPKSSAAQELQNSLQEESRLEEQEQGQSLLQLSDFDNEAKEEQHQATNEPAEEQDVLPQSVEEAEAETLQGTVFEEEEHRALNWEPVDGEASFVGEPIA